MTEELGTVISTPDSPSPANMSFVVNSGAVHRGMFVELDYSEGTMIAFVNNLVKTNRYFERADSVKEFESNGVALNEQFPTTEWEFLVAQTRPLGVFRDGMIKRATLPAGPGTKVRVASKENLNRFLSFSQEDGLHLGEVEFHGIPVKLQLSKLLQKHAAILALSGAGKCVSPKTEILFSDGSRKEIGKLVDEKLSKGFKVEDGVEFTENNDPKLKVVSVNPNNRLTFSTIKAFTRRKAPKTMYQIKTRTGKQIELTPEHLVPVLDGEIRWTQAKDLREGNVLLGPKEAVGKKGTLQLELFFDPVLEITQFKPDFEYVYDLAVEARNFTANNLIIHNSYLVSVMLEELLDRKKEHGRIAVVVLDVHGEYTNFAQPVTDKEHKDYSSRSGVVKARDIKIGVPKLSAFMLSAMMPGSSAVQRRDLGRVMEKLKTEMKSGVGPYDLNSIKTEIIKDEEIKENSKKALLAWLGELEEMRLFGKFDSPAVEELVKPGELTVVDLSQIVNVKKKQLIVNYFSQKLFQMRRKKEIPPFLMVLEEAHQFIPERAGKETALARSILQTIAREGRKFGACLCLISQRPIQLSTTVLSQCNSHIILRITNPYDLKHIGQSCEGLDSRSEEMISGLKVGEALIIGEATGFPLFFKVRERKSPESSHEIPLELAAREFEEKSTEKKREAKQFLGE